MYLSMFVFASRHYRFFHSSSPSRTRTHTRGSRAHTRAPLLPVSPSVARAGNWIYENKRKSIGSDGVEESSRGVSEIWKTREREKRSRTDETSSSPRRKSRDYCTFREFFASFALLSLSVSLSLPALYILLAQLSRKL